VTLGHTRLVPQASWRRYLTRRSPQQRPVSPLMFWSVPIRSTCESRFFEGVITVWSIGSDGSLSEPPSSPFATVNSFNFVSGVATNKAGTRLHDSLASSSLIVELGINRDSSLYRSLRRILGSLRRAITLSLFFLRRRAQHRRRAGDACINRQNARGEGSSLTHGTSRGRIAT